MILPALALGLVGAPYLIRMIRSIVIEIMKEPFVPYADARGLRERVIFWRYIIRNLLPQFMVVLGRAGRARCLRAPSRSRRCSTGRAWAASSSAP